MVIVYCYYSFMSAVQSGAHLTLSLQQGIAELGAVLLFLQLCKKLDLMTRPPVPLHVLMSTDSKEGRESAR